MTSLIYLLNRLDGPLEDPLDVVAILTELRIRLDKGLISKELHDSVKKYVENISKKS